MGFIAELMEEKNSLEKAVQESRNLHCQVNMKMSPLKCVISRRTGKRPNGTPAKGQWWQDRFQLFATKLKK